MPATRTDGLLSLAVIAAIFAMPVSGFAQTTSAPATITVPGTITLLAPTTAPAATSPATLTVTQPFVGAVTSEKVYIRSGPGGVYYEMGQLSKGDLVEVVGSRLGWYQILPPNGTFCMIAKEFVDLDATGATGTVKKDYVNVRAGTALYKGRDPSAVLTVVRKGAQLKVLGSTDTYYEIAPPEKAYVYISPQFVQAKEGATYVVPNLKLPNGLTGPAKDTVSAPTTLPAPTVDIPFPTPTIATTLPADSGVVTVEPTPTPTPDQPQTVVVPPAPAVVFSATAAAKFAELNTRYQEELRKPLAKRDIDGLLKDYQTLAAEPNLQPSVKQGTESRITALQKLATLQQLSRESTASEDALAAQQKALQEQYSAAEKAVNDYENSGPYAAEGLLQTSTAVEGKYAVVDPATGRVVAYVDPKADIDIASLLGKYVGIRGPSHTQDGTQITVIEVKTATLLPNPAVTKH